MTVRLERSGEDYVKDYLQEAIDSYTADKRPANKKDLHLALKRAPKSSGILNQLCLAAINLEDEDLLHRYINVGKDWSSTLTSCTWQEAVKKFGFGSVEPIITDWLATLPSGIVVDRCRELIRDLQEIEDSQIGFGDWATHQELAGQCSSSRSTCLLTP